MSTTLDPLGDPLAGTPGDPALEELRAAFLRARARDTTVRLSLAMFRARGYAQVWGQDDEARRWSSAAERLRIELADLDRRIAAATAGGAPAGAALPVDVPSAPVDAASGPVDVPSAPVDAASGPVDAGWAPVEVASASVDAASEPVTAAPVGSASGPVDAGPDPVTAAPAGSARGPVGAGSDHSDASGRSLV